MTRKQSRTFWLVLTTVLLCSSCARVQPWERAALAHRLSRADAWPHRSSLSNHAVAAREGAATAGGEAGGGCGCD